MAAGYLARIVGLPVESDFLVVTPEEKRNSERPKQRSGNNIKQDVDDVGCRTQSNMEDLVQDRVA